MVCFVIHSMQTNFCDSSMACCDDPLESGVDIGPSTFGGESRVAGLAEQAPIYSPQSYWDIYTDDQIPPLERAIGGAFLPVAIVGSFFGAGCGGEETVPPANQPPVIEPVDDGPVREETPPASPHSSPPPPYPTWEYATCPQAVIGSDGEITAAWMDASYGETVPKLVTGDPAHPELKKVIATTGENICDGNKALSLMAGGNTRLCWKKEGNLFCQNLTADGERVGSFPTQIASAIGVYSMKTFDDDTSAMIWTSAEHAYLQIFAPSGFPNTSLIDLGQGEAVDVDVAGDNVLAAWSASGEMYAAKYTKEGLLTSSADLRLHIGNYADEQREISAAMNRDGFFAVGELPGPLPPITVMTCNSASINNPACL